LKSSPQGRSKADATIPRALCRLLPQSVAFVSTVLVAGMAQAQTTSDQRAPSQNGDGMDTHLFRPAVDSKGFISTNGPAVLAKGDYSFGMVLDYGSHLMRTNPDRTEGAGGQPPAAGDSALVHDSYQGTFAFNYGLFDAATVGVSTPVLLMTGDPVNEIGENGALYNSGELDAQKLSSLALHAKLRLLPVEKGFGAAVIGQAGVPISAAPRDLGADPGFWYWPRLAIEARVGHMFPFRVGLEGGYRGHTGANPRFDQDSIGRSQLAEGAFIAGDLATFGLALSLRAMKSLDLVAETYGSYLLSDADSAQRTSQEVIGGIKLFINSNSFLTMAAGSRFFSTGFEAADTRLVLGFVFEPSIGDADGDGIRDDQDECPMVPEDFDGDRDDDGCPEDDRDGDGIPDAQDKCVTIPEDLDGDEDSDGCPEIRETDSDHDHIVDSRDRCPNDPEDFDGYQDKDGCPDLDNDKDGIPDDKDRCPDDPEDKDGYKDEDGCPDPDNDGDHIPDSRDKCPMDPENFNGYQDQDGCPEKTKVVVEDNSILILEQVKFETGSARIRPESNELLDEVARTLAEHPEFLVVEVAGHADERGSDESNLRLTKARAASVVEALERRHISPKRLVSQGYGEYCPLDAKSTRAAWAKNRRVEFKIVKTTKGLTTVSRGCIQAAGAGVNPPPVR